MRYTVFFLVAILGFALIGCQDDVAVTSADQEIQSEGIFNGQPDQQRLRMDLPDRRPVNKNFAAVLSGMNEVPEPAETDAAGAAGFHFSRDGSMLFYKIHVTRLENTLMAHIHLGGPDENGPVAAWLYPEGPPPELIPGEFTGMLAEGVITAEDLVGPLEGQTMDSLKSEIMSGNTYVNVHTEQYPGGEIRGQIDSPPARPKDVVAQFRVTFENMTPATGEGSSQPMSPPVLASHTSGIHIFQLGHYASEELRLVAEDAVAGPLLELLNESDMVFDVVQGDGVVLPGESMEFMIEAKIPFNRLSIVTMLVNTNDAFTGIDAIPLNPRRQQEIYLKALDAGTEENTEMTEHIPGPCCGNPMVRVPTEERILFHPGILGTGDLDPEIYDWDEPAAKITITPVNAIF